MNAGPALDKTASSAPRLGRATLTTWLSVIGALLLFVGLRWNSFNAPLIRDEGEYAYAASLFHHGLVPYRDAFLQKPPMVIYTYAIADLIAPNAFWLPRVLAAIFIALATLLLGYIARLEFSPGAGLVAAWLFIPMVLLPGLEEFTANTEMFMLLPLLGVVATYVTARRRGSSRRPWFLAGSLAAVTLWYKYTAAPLLALVLIYWAVEEWRSAKYTRTLAMRWVWGAAGALVTSVLVLGLFLLQDGGRALWECTIQFNRHYAQSNNFALSALGDWLLIFLKQWWVLFVLMGALFLKPIPRVWFWLGVLLMAWLSTGASYYGQYYLMPMPFWALLAAAGVCNAAGWLAPRVRLSQSSVAGLVTGVVVILLCWPDWLWLSQSPAQFAAGKFGITSNPFLEAPAVGRRVAAMTSPQDLVLVAGSEPEILSYAHRISPTRFVITAPLMIPSPVALDYQQEYIRDITTRQPAVVILVRPNSSWLMEENSPRDLPLFLVNFLATKYQRVGGFVTTPNRHWEEPLGETNVLNSSLIVFRKL